MRLHISDDAGKPFYCPECERELWPAYWTEEEKVQGRILGSHGAEFGNYDGDVYEYEGHFSCTEIEATRWDEHLLELPSAEP